MRPVYAGPLDPAGPDVDCEDFDSWDAVQGFFLAAGGPETDRHRLDADGGRGIKGIACEALPGSPVRDGVLIGAPAPAPGG